MTFAHTPALPGSAELHTKPDLHNGPVFWSQSSPRPTAVYIPARFIKEMTVKRGNDLVFRMESTFSISTNPNFRFTFGRGADNDIDVSMVDA